MAITNVAVVPMDKNRVLPDQTVVIDDGLIKAIGPSASVSIDGMSIVAGSNKYLLPGLTDMHVHYIHEELANFVGAGMTPYEALKCATSEAARSLGQSEVWGTVDEGKRADLILVQGNPLSAIESLRNLEAVFINGFHLTSADLERLLNEQSALASLDPLASSPEPMVSRIPSSANTTYEGAWIERQGDRVVGRIDYTHRTLPSGEWIVEERHVFEQGAVFEVGGSQRHSIKLRLKSDPTICEATLREESWVGEVHSFLTLTDSGAYHLRRIDEDGHEVEEDLGDRPLLPDPTLVLSQLEYDKQVDADLSPLSSRERARACPVLDTGVRVNYNIKTMLTRC